MIKPDLSELLISLPFGEALQTANSPRYLWDNSQRGGGSFVIIQWTLEGVGAFSKDGREWLVPPGHAFIAVVPEPSQYYFPKQATEPWKFAWFNFYGPQAITVIRAFQKSFGPVVPLPRRSVAGGQFLRLVGLAKKRSLQDIYDVSGACYTFLMEWTRQLSRPINQDQVETAAALCRSRFREAIGIKELADETGLSREHLTRIFTVKLGISPGRYLRNLRVEAAESMLSGQSMSLKEVALRSGFASVRSLKMALKS